INPPPPPAPVINSTLTRSGTVGSAFSYQIGATNAPTSYGAIGLPGGLSLNSVNGLITGTPTAAGTTNVTISATNAGGTGLATLAVTIYPSPVDSNVAYNQPVTASSFEAGNLVANANDGSTTTRWAASSATYPQWWRVDL